MNATPDMLHQGIQNEFPWGGSWPPKTSEQAGNYADMAWHAVVPHWDYIDGYSDGFPTTAPVMSFKPNKLGIYDLGGNQWEFVEDWSNEKSRRVLRGGSWDNAKLGYPLSSFRGYTEPEGR